MPRITLSLALATALVLSVACADPGGVSPQTSLAVQPVVQQSAWSRDWWLPRHSEKIEEAKRRDIDVVFIGDSITHGWENEGAETWQAFYGERNALNLGFSGDRTEHVLWRLQNGALDDIAPSLIVLMIGTNNTGYRMDAAADTAAGIARIVADLRERQPQSKVLLLGIFPRHVSPQNDMRKRNGAINERIAALADDDGVAYLDIGPSFVNADGTLRSDLMPDLLHLNPAGYGVWAEAMEPTVQRLLATN